MEARPRKRTGYMRGEMRSGGECARATEMPATATEAANVNAAAMKAGAATAEAATTTGEAPPRARGTTRRRRETRHHRRHGLRRLSGRHTPPRTVTSRKRARQ